MSGETVRVINLDEVEPQPHEHGEHFAAEFRQLGRPLGAELLEPTRIHAPDVLALADALGTALHAACHVTGGGLPGNLPRVMPEGLVAEVDDASWDLPPLFRWLAERGPVVDDELRRTFNCGVGMVAVVAPDAVDAAVDLLAGRGTPAWVLGRVGPARR